MGDRHLISIRYKAKEQKQFVAHKLVVYMIQGQIYKNCLQFKIISLKYKYKIKSKLKKLFLSINYSKRIFTKKKNCIQKIDFICKHKIKNDQNLIMMLKMLRKMKKNYPKMFLKCPLNFEV